MFTRVAKSTKSENPEAAVCSSLSKIANWNQEDGANLIGIWREEKYVKNAKHTHRTGRTEQVGLWKEGLGSYESIK